MKKFLLAFSILFSAFQTRAAVYYVSSASGNDSYNGSSGTPWASLQHAADVVKPGDSVVVKAGTYVGFVMGWDGYQSGTPSKRIIFKAENGATITSKNNKTADGINLEGTSYITLDGFTITNAGKTITRAGIRCVQDTGVIVRNNNIDGMGTWGILTGFSENILIENNVCSHSGTQHGIYFGNSADNPIIRYNTCFSNGGCGIHMNADSVQGGDGIIKNALVEGNIIYDNGTLGGAAINMDGIQNSKVINNLLYNNHAGGISVFQIDGKEPSKNNLYYNNTVIMPSDGRWAMNINSGSTGNTLYNNIFLSYHSFRGGIVIDAESLSGFKSDYNAVIDRFSADGDNSIITLTDWKTQTGQDAHSIIVTNTELFMNAASNDYHLKSGCKAINTGTSSVVSIVAKDLEKHARPMGSSADIGCYEFVEGVVTYALTVNGGTGSGSYTAGQTVSVSANAPALGKVFDKWTGDVAGITNVNAAATTMTMPSAAASITATYKNKTGLNSREFTSVFYPNPVHDEMVITKTGTAYIFDTNGTLLLQKTIQQEHTSVQVGKLNAGIYILEIRNGDEVITEKFVKY